MIKKKGPGRRVNLQISLSGHCILFLLTILLMISGACISCNSSQKESQKNIIKFEDTTREAGLERYSESFGAVFIDVDNDGDDDLIVSNHGLITPSVFLNENGFFEDRSFLLDFVLSRDWHGVTAADLDNDGDKDIAVAGGGGGGIQGGAPNLLFQNILAETGRLHFRDIAHETGIVNQMWRGRHFLPVASSDGAAVDLYFICRPRENITNLYFLNASKGGSIILKRESPLGLNIQSGSEGRGDGFVDFDRDGDRDLFILDNGHLVVYENKRSRFYKSDRHFSDTRQIETLAVGDLNRDGYPDLYLGARARYSRSDSISFGSIDNERKLHFYVSNKKKNDTFDSGDRVDFKSSSSEIHIDFIREPGLSANDPSDIFIGRNNLNPSSRAALISAEMARGKPLLSSPGTYIWNDGGRQWSIHWIYSETQKEERGIITASNLDSVEPKMLESFEKEVIADRIFINQEGLGFQEFKGIDLSHQMKTRAVAIEDFNNDGWPDIIGLRGTDPGDFNGKSFIFQNRGNLQFEPQKTNPLENKEDDIGQADLMIVGFVNGDGLPDIFVTNGFGLIPGNRGPYKLFINRSISEHNYVILELEGRASNRDALGAQVALHSGDGALIGYRELGAGFNRMQNTHKLHFGLGLYLGKLEARILWPTGHLQTVDVFPNRINHIIEN